MEELESVKVRIRQMYAEARAATLAAEGAWAEARKLDGHHPSEIEGAYGGWRYAVGEEMALFRVLLALGDDV